MNANSSTRPAKTQEDYHGGQRAVGGISASNRERLQRLHQHGAPVDSATAAGLWETDIDAARSLLGYLARQGWLSRVRRGWYTPVPLESREPGEWSEDSWIVAALAFAPCYIGGWSACEHWDLTEQIFREVLVVTARPIRSRHTDIQGIPVRLKSRKLDKMFGTRTVWRSTVRVEVSDPSRTVVDILDDPQMGGGIRQVAAMVGEYFATEHRDDELVAQYADRLGNRTVFKRLGYILESLSIDAPRLLAVCRDQRSKGLTMLDPSAAAGGPIVRRWGLRVNVELRAEDKT